MGCADTVRQEHLRLLASIYNEISTPRSFLATRAVELSRSIQAGHVILKLLVQPIQSFVLAHAREK